MWNYLTLRGEGFFGILMATDLVFPAHLSVKSSFAVVGPECHIAATFDVWLPCSLPVIYLAIATNICDLSAGSSTLIGEFNATGFTKSAFQAYRLSGLHQELSPGLSLSTYQQLFQTLDHLDCSRLTLDGTFHHG